MPSSLRPARWHIKRMSSFFNDGPRLGGCVFFSSLSVEKKEQQNLKTDFFAPQKHPFHMTDAIRD